MSNTSGLQPDLIGFYNSLLTHVPNARLTSGKRSASQGIGKAYKTSRHNTGEAMDFAPTPELAAFIRSPQGVALMRQYKVGYLDETTKEALAKSGGTGAHFHIGKDSALVARVAGMPAQPQRGQVVQPQQQVVQPQQQVAQPVAPVYDPFAEAQALYSLSAPVNIQPVETQDTGNDLANMLSLNETNPTIDYTKYF